MKQRMWRLVRWPDGTYGASRTVDGVNELYKREGRTLGISKADATRLVSQLNGRIPEFSSEAEFNEWTGHVHMSSQLRDAIRMITLHRHTWSYAAKTAGCTESGILKAMRRVVAANPGA